MDQIFEKFKEIKPRISSSKIKRLGILDFQERILKLIRRDMPILDQMNYISIVAKNIESFMIERLPEIRSYREFKITVRRIRDIMQRINNLVEDRAVKYGICDMLDKHYNCAIVSYLYLAMQQSCYAEETDIEKIREQLTILRSENKPCIGLTDSRLVIRNTSESEYNVVYWFVCPRSFLLIDEYVEAFKRKFKDSDSVDTANTDLPVNFKDELDRGEEYLIRCPYDNYDIVLKFISEMCTYRNINSIWITLYRVNPKDSRIVKCLKDAAKMGKKVFVFIELNARGDELNNYNVCEELKVAGCHVKTDYFGYKVHGKMFLAMDDNGHLYGHIGTGNYNEKTARQYTDIHYITSKRDITHEMFSIFIALFEKRIYRTNTDDAKIFSSPTNIRPIIVKLIEEEIRKGKDGRIYIKVNNLCDNGITSLLYDAANAGVDVRIICRTACTLKPIDNLSIRSKAGIYLEHDRIYIFGNRTFIGSADLLFRNISKRFEIMCEVEKDEIYNYFMNVWNDRPIYEIDKEYEWRLLP